MKKNRILSSVVTIALCLCLIAGSTFALFTSSDEVNIAVTAGNVSVDAYLDSFATFSMDKAQPAMTFANGGTAAYTNGVLTLDRVTPGDEITFNVNITNNSDVAAQYRIKASMEGKLGEVLETYITFEGETVAAQVDDLGMDAVSDWNALADGTTVVPMSILLPEEVGNEYQGATAAIAITVEAIQGNGEGMVYYNDQNYDTLNAAIDAALADGDGAGDVITVAGKVDLVLPTGTSFVYDLKGLTINGHAYSTVVFKNPDGSTTAGTGATANVNMSNLTIVDETFYPAENGENAWEFTYLEFDGTNTFTNVVFTDGISLEGTESTFEGCTFIGHNNDSSTYGNGTMYGAWVSNGIASFYKCTFKGTRGLKMHECYGTDIVAVKVDTCTFYYLSQKPGVAIGDIAVADVDIINSTFDHCQAGDQGLYIYESDTDVAGFDFYESNNTVLPMDILKPLAPTVDADGVYHIASTNNWAWLIEESKLAPIGTNKVYVNIVLDEDLDFMGREIEPIAHLNTSYINFDGQGNTISNFVINVDELAAPFGSIHGTVKNLCVENADITSLHYAGGVVAKGYVNVEGCSVTNVTIDATNVGGEDGRHVGGIIGYHAEGPFTLKNNTVTNVTITAEGCAAWLVGTCQYANKTDSNIQKDITGNVRNNVTVIDAGHLAATSTYKGTVSDTHYAGYDRQLPKP